MLDNQTGYGFQTEYHVFIRKHSRPWRHTAPAAQHTHTPRPGLATTLRDAGLPLLVGATLAVARRDGTSRKDIIAWVGTALRAVRATAALVPMSAEPSLLELFRAGGSSPKAVQPRVSKGRPYMQWNIPSRWAGGRSDDCFRSKSRKLMIFREYNPEISA